MNVDKSIEEIFKEAKELFDNRNEEYGDAYLHAGKVYAALFPDGIELKTVEDFTRFSLFRHIMNKMIRYARNLSDGGHSDSAIDAIVYSAMLAQVTKEK